MSDMYFENLPNTTTPLNKTNLNKLNDIKVSPTEPTTGEKVWIQKGKNLFDINTMVELVGKYRPYDAGTYIIENSSVNGIKFPVEPNWTYSFSSNASSNSHICFFDKDFSYISGDAFVNGTTFTTPANCYYVTMAVENDYTWIQIEQGSTVTSPEAYIDKKIYTKNNNGVYEEFDLTENCAKLETTPTTPNGDTKISFMQLSYNNGWKLYVKAITNGEEHSFQADLTQLD